MELKTDKEKFARSKICLPLDVPTLDDARPLVEGLSPWVGLYKINSLFVSEGVNAIKYIKAQGANLFLDLKWHDIPNTMRNYGKIAAFHDVYMVNCHATAGVDAMKALKEGVHEGAERHGTSVPKVVAVTVLTSLDNQRYVKTFKPNFKGFDAISQERYNGVHEGEDEHEAFRQIIEECGLTHVVQDQVKHLAELAHEAGLDGIVCSAADLEAVRDYMPDNFMYVTPGIKGKSVGTDQARTFTAANAVRDGSSILVVGRAITDPRSPDEKEANLEVTVQMQQKAAYDMIQSMVPEIKYI